MRSKRATQLRKIAHRMTIGESEKKTKKVLKGLKKSYKNRSPALMQRLSEYEKNPNPFEV